MLEVQAVRSEGRKFHGLHGFKWRLRACSRRIHLRDERRHKLYACWSDVLGRWNEMNNPARTWTHFAPARAEPFLPIFFPAATNFRTVFFARLGIIPALAASFRFFLRAFFAFAVFFTLHTPQFAFALTKATRHLRREMGRTLILHEK